MQWPGLWCHILSQNPVQWCNKYIYILSYFSHLADTPFQSNYGLETCSRALTDFSPSLLGDSNQHLLVTGPTHLTAMARTRSKAWNIRFWHKSYGNCHSILNIILKLQTFLNVLWPYFYRCVLPPSGRKEHCDTNVTDPRFVLLFFLNLYLTRQVS